MARRGAPRAAPSRRGMPRMLPAALSALVVALFFVAVGVWALAGRVPPEVLYVYGFASLCTFILYAMDKSAARRGRLADSGKHTSPAVAGRRLARGPSRSTNAASQIRQDSLSPGVPGDGPRELRSALRAVRRGD